MKRMNWYEEKQEAKKQRLQKRVAKIRVEAEEKSKAGWDALQAIPFGQPILLGHYSARGDRAYRSRAIGKIDRSVEMQKEADALAAKAESIGAGGISSDDPEVVAK